MNLPRVAVVDDQSFCRSGVSLAIKTFKFVEFAFEAANGFEFLDRQRKKPADVVLLEVLMPEFKGYETFRILKRDYPQIKIIIFTTLEKEDAIQQLLDNGIHGYILKNTDKKGLSAALKAVINGHFYFSEQIMMILSRKLMEHQKKDNEVTLTKRELEILHLIYQGLSNKEIAEKLFVSTRTITNHRYNLKIKTSAKNTAGLIAYGLKHNFFS